MKLIHLTDPHFCSPGATVYGRDSKPPFDAALDDINRYHADADAVIITGDLANRGEKEAYINLKHSLKRLNVPYYLQLGNHDNRERFRDIFPEQESDGNEFIQYSFELHNHLFVVLDSIKLNSHGAELCEKRLDWLDKQLEKAELPVMLLTHHAPFEIGIPSMDVIAFSESNRAEFWEVLNQHKKVKHLFFGHYHRPISGNWRGVSFSCLKGTNHQVALDLKTTEVIHGSYESPTYNVVLIQEHGVIVHTRDFTDKTDTYSLGTPFENCTT